MSSYSMSYNSFVSGGRRARLCPRPRAARPTATPARAARAAALDAAHVLLLRRRAAERDDHAASTARSQRPGRAPTSGRAARSRLRRCRRHAGSARTLWRRQPEAARRCIVACMGSTGSKISWTASRRTEFSFERRGGELKPAASAESTASPRSTTCCRTRRRKFARASGRSSIRALAATLTASAAPAPPLRRRRRLRVAGAGRNKRRSDSTPKVEA